MANLKKEDILHIITTLTLGLSDSAKVELMTMLYYDLDAYHKDEFLRETDNA